ncbi:U-box domain-containing protein 35-like [Tasmannia lanceolata]|uniref:U-box domain-containing protein 35-like n=1 Tax=Tasmannia lanceolata TaxID=3420 RepID=UPI0040630BF8
MEIHDVEEELALSSPLILTVAVAVNGNRNSKFAVKWALEKFSPQGRVLFKMIHVRPKIDMVPTPMGNSLPISKVRDDVAAAYKKEIKWKTDAMLLPYKKMCAQKQVEAEAVVIEADDVADAISVEVAKFSISTLVIGASSRSSFMRKFKGCGISSRISGCIPSFCTVYIVSKGRLSSVHTSVSDTNESIKANRSDSSLSTNTFSSHASSTPTEWTDICSAANSSPFHFSSLPVQRYQALLSINQAILNRKSSTINLHDSRHLSLSTEEDTASSSSSYTEIQYGSCRSFQTDNESWNSNQASTSHIRTDSSLSESQVDVNLELERLRIELRHVKGMCAVAQNETSEASRQLNELSRRRMEENIRLKEINFREEKVKQLARQIKGKSEDVKKEAEFVRECAKREAQQRIEAEAKVARDAGEKKRMEKALTCSDQQYQKFTWEEIVSATSSFSDDLRIGMGAYGIVYKCSLHHTIAAVKVLHSTEEHSTKQFQQELEILSMMHHPHLLLLLGACPEHGCLVYEYMENGSLDDRLIRKSNTPPIPWFDRYRIAWEIASALVFLHNSKPKPIVHRDLKPANILLDRNFVSKIGDVGLSTLLPAANPSMSTMGKDTAPVGTLCYIDPEYQRSGLVTPKSDVYAFGMVILQLLTAKSPMALAHIVETSLQEGCLLDILDSEAGNWPLEETQELAVLGLSCAELRRIDRPDLMTQVLPMLERLKQIADRARDSALDAQLVPPSHFICPILQDVMNDPCVAADGFTYDRSAIEIWLSMNDKSPMTNVPLLHKNLIPNYALLPAIMEWKSKNQ